MTPFITVIIPNYNHAAYLKQRIDSIINQTYQHFEIIILDDYSTDNSREIIDQYRNHHKVSSIIYNKINSGSAFLQWQKGILLSKGEYIWIAESDDWCKHNFLEIAINTLNNNDLILFFSQSYRVDEDGKILNNFLWWTKDLNNYNWERNFIANGTDFIKYCQIKKNVIVNASAVVFRKQNFSIVFFKISKLKKCGDWFFWVILMLNKNIAYYAEPLNFFRDHNMSTRNLNDIHSKLVRLVEDYYVKTNIYDLIKDKQVLTHLRCSYFQIFKNTPFLKFKLLKSLFMQILDKKLYYLSFLLTKIIVKLKIIFTT